ncbi:MAG: hypothetical protein ABIQ99_04555 [Thermoflexales bacterium]
MQRYSIAYLADGTADAQRNPAHRADRDLGPADRHNSTAYHA